MRPTHVLLAFVLILAFATTQSAVQQQPPSTTGKDLPPLGDTVGDSNARPGRIRATDPPDSGKPGDWNKPGAKRPIDISQVKVETQEIQKLVQGLPDQISKIQNGVLPADLVANLKKIEKLSKHLRAEIS